MEDREILIEALHILHARLEPLRSMEGPEMLLPGRIETYRNTLEDGYAAYVKIEILSMNWARSEHSNTHAWMKA